MFEIEDGCSVMIAEVQCCALVRMQFVQTLDTGELDLIILLRRPGARVKKMGEPMISDLASVTFIFRPWKVCSKW